MKLFLSSLWKNMVVLTWEIEPELLIEHVPHKIGIYTQNDKAYISLVAYQYENTKVKGVKMPFHVSFTEIDLRYYVKHQEQLGVGFIQHIVPRYCISLWAKRIFNENYITLPMDYSFQNTETSKVIHYKLWKDKRLFSIDVLANQDLVHTDWNEMNLVQFGIGMDKYGNTTKFQFEKNENFRSYTVIDYALNIDFAFLFGRKWGFLKDLQPVQITVLNDNKIRIFQPYYVYDKTFNTLATRIQEESIQEELITKELP